MIQVRIQFESVLNEKPKAKYVHETLFCGMSKCLCVAKNKRVIHQRKDQGASEEGKIQAAQNFQLKLQVKTTKINLFYSRVPPTPLLTIGLETLTNRYIALLDFGVDTNILPLSIFHWLKNKAAIATQDTLYNFQKAKVQSYGVVKILVYIEGVEISISFQVVECSEDE